MTSKLNCLDFAPVGVVFQAPWDANQLIKAQPYDGCAGCLGETVIDYCEQLPLCGIFSRTDGVAVRYIAVEEE